MEAHIVTAAGHAPKLLTVATEAKALAKERNGVSQPVVIPSTKAGQIDTINGLLGMAFHYGESHGVVTEFKAAQVRDPVEMIQDGPIMLSPGGCGFEPLPDLNSMGRPDGSGAAEKGSTPFPPQPSPLDLTTVEEFIQEAEHAPLASIMSNAIFRLRELEKRIG